MKPSVASACAPQQAGRCVAFKQCFCFDSAKFHQSALDQSALTRSPRTGLESIAGVNKKIVFFDKNVESAAFQPVGRFRRAVEASKTVHYSQQPGRGRLRQSYDRIAGAFERGFAIKLRRISGPNKRWTFAVIGQYRVPS